MKRIGECFSYSELHEIKYELKAKGYQLENGVVENLHIDQINVVISLDNTILGRIYWESVIEKYINNSASTSTKEIVQW